VPVFQIAGPEHIPDQPQEPVIVQLLAQDGQQDLVVQSFKTLGNVALDEPVGTLPSGFHFAQCSVTAASGSETMGVPTKLGVVIRIEDRAYYLLEQLVGPGREAQRAQIPVFLRDIRPLHWRPSIAFMPQIGDERVDFVQ